VERLDDVVVAEPRREVTVVGVGRRARADVGGREVLGEDAATVVGEEVLVRDGVARRGAGAAGEREANDRGLEPGPAEAGGVDADLDLDAGGEGCLERGIGGGGGGGARRRGRRLQRPPRAPAGISGVAASACEWELAPAAATRATRARWSSARDRHREEREDGERGDTIQAGARCSLATAWLWKNEMDLRLARNRREKRFCIVGARPAKGAVSCIPRAWPWYFGPYQTHPEFLEPRHAVQG
jgi:hypothetical protein